MTEKVNPSPVRPAEAFKTAGAIALAGGSDPGYVSPAANPSQLSVQDSSINESALNAFAQTSSGSSFDVTIDGGEAFVYGSYLAIDSPTTVTLASSTASQTVYAGWNKEGTDDVIVGLQSAFDNASGNTDKKVELFEFDTDGSGVTSVTDLREIGQFLNPDHVDIVEELGVPVYADTTNAPQVEGSVIYIDGSSAQSSGIYSHDGVSYVKSGNTDEAIEDVVANLLVASGDLSINYDDANNELVLDAQNLTTEEVQDTVDSLLASGNAIDLTYDDPNDTLTVDVTEADIDLSNLTGDTDSLTEGSSNLFFTDERAQDAVGGIISGGNNVSVTYDDVNDTLTIDTSALDQEEVEDSVNALLTSGNAIDLTYDDPNDTLTVDVSESDISLSNLSGDSDSITEGSTNLFFSNERAQDAVGSITSGGDKITVTYNDSNDELRVDTEALDQEEVEDQVNTLLSSGGAISLNYDDAGGDLTIDVTDTDAITEGSSNLFFTDERAQDAVGSIATGDEHVNVTYDDVNNTITIDVLDDWQNQDLFNVRKFSAEDVNLGQDWEIRVDAPNNRLLIEYTPNGSRFELNEDGTLAPLDGGIDTSGSDKLTVPVVADVPSLSSLPQGSIAFVQSEDTIYVQVD